MTRREYLRRMMEAPHTLTLQHKLDYLEECYRTDRLSRDTRHQLAREIRETQEAIAARGAAAPRHPELRDRQSRIRIQVGRRTTSGTRRTTVELPFTELNPTLTGGAGNALAHCVLHLDALSHAERDVVLANLLARYGSVE